MTTGIATVGIVPRALIVAEPAAVALSINSASANASYCACVAVDAKPHCNTDLAVIFESDI